MTLDSGRRPRRDRQRGPDVRMAESRDLMDLLNAEADRDDGPDVTHRRRRDRRD